MNDRDVAKLRRAERRARELATWTPVCRVCGLSGLSYRYEHHHIAAKHAGRRLCEATVLLCRQCHDRISDMQNELPPLPKWLNPRLALRINGHLGAAMLLELIASLERDEANEILAHASLDRDGEGEP